MKAVIITKKNQKTLAERYITPLDQEEIDEEFPIGHYAMADFGSDILNGVVSPMNFAEGFTQGQALKNDWFEVVPK